MPSQEVTFGLILLASLIFVVATLAIVIMIARRMKTREREALAVKKEAAAKRRIKEKIKKIESTLIVKEWTESTNATNEDSSSEHDLDLEAQQQPCRSPLQRGLSDEDLTVCSLEADQDAVLSEDNNKAGLPEQGVCAICLEPYRQGEFVAGNRRCQHEFHRDCNAGWLMIRDECPCCRQMLLDKKTLRRESEVKE